MLAKEKKLKIVGSGAILVATIIWGSTFFILKNSLNVLPTFFVLAVRFVIAALLLGTFCFKTVVKTDKKTAIRGIILGIVLTGGYGIQTLGLQYTTPAKNAFLTAAYCVIVPFLGWAMLKKKPTLFNVMAAVICMIGIGLISIEGGFYIGKGDVLTLISAVFFAMQILCNAMFIKKSDFRQVLFVAFCTVAVVCFIISLSAETMPTKITFNQWLPILYLGIFGSFVAQFMQMFGQKYTTANNASIILSTEAVFGALFSVAFYHERPSIQMICGFVVMLFAIIVSEVGYDFTQRLKIKVSKKGDKKYG